MSRIPPLSAVLVTAGLFSAACGHVQRMDLPEQMSRVESVPASTTVAGPATAPQGPSALRQPAPATPPTVGHDTGGPSPEQRLQEGLAALTEGDADKAIVLAEEVLRGDSNNARAHCLLGMAYLQLDGADGIPRPLLVNLAEQELCLALTLAPDYPPALYHLAVAALRRGDAPTAEGYLDSLRDTGRATAAVATLEQIIGRRSPMLAGANE